MRIHSFQTPLELGKACGDHAARILAERLTSPGTARVMLAAAPSQQFTLRALGDADLDFSRIEFFHMDEYLGLPPTAPQAFGNWLHRELISRVTPAAFHRIDPTGDAEAEAARYSAVIGPEGFDLTLCGLGVNGHLAFNDPPADLHDPSPVRVVRMDEASRRQQFDEGHFPNLDEVPTHAITVTIPQLLKARHVLVSVPGRAKRRAVGEALDRPISGEHPGTALRTHPDVDLYLDADSDPR
ncbi:MAG TPA: 6-phosphogluconolactonase [Sinomonas sp.]|nr:6-phosphogluconolactonase [Sinomonas sp.]